MTDNDLIERTRLAAQILRDIGGQSAMAATVDEAADALEAARADAVRWRYARENWHRLATATRPDGNGGVICAELFIMPAHEDDPPLTGLDAAIDAAMAAEGRE